MRTDLRSVDRCRACGGGDLLEVLDLGVHAVSDFLEDGQELDRAPLTLLRCNHCTLVQLAHTVPRDRLYRRYWYRSGTNETMVAALRDVVAEAISHVELHAGDAVLDIGANDGTLLSSYPPALRRIAVEPSNIGREVWPHADTLINDFFPPPEWVHPEPCKVITSIAMFYDLEDPNAFCEAIKRWLHPEGVWVVQFQDLSTMLRCNGFDNVCHEHLLYLDRASMANLLEPHGLAIDTWSENRVNGGSLRLVVRHADRARNQAPVPDPWRATSWHDLEGFRQRVEMGKQETVEHLRGLKRFGHRVLGIGASTKFGTLSQYYGLGPDLVEAIGDRNSEKHGRRTVTGIPVVSEEEMRARQPHTLFCGAWQFAEAFAERERALLEQGTRLIAPLPDFREIVPQRAVGESNPRGLAALAR